MNQITELEWLADRIEHIQVKHRVTPKEVEEACFSCPLILRGRGKQVYQILSQTLDGRYLFIVVRFLGQGKARVITAREMEQTERQRYSRR